MTRVTVPLHFTVEMFSQITGWQRRVLHPRLRSRLARRLTQTQLGHIHRFRWGGFRRRRRGAPTVEPSQCGTGNSQAKACEREITFPTASEQLRPHLTWGGGGAGVKAASQGSFTRQHRGGRWPCLTVVLGRVVRWGKCDKELLSVPEGLCGKRLRSEPAYLDLTAPE